MIRKSLFVALAAAGCASAPLFAQATDPVPRPRVGLVLSGGGARGAAHIGVLKVLEALGIRIDAIAGTSMGAVVGGLYASGMSAHEIEGVLTSVNWQDAFRDRPPRADLNFRRKSEDQNFLVKFPLGLKSGDFRLPKGLVQGQKLNQLLRRLTLPVATIHDFDQLPTRFRAVATDLETGQAVVLKDGDLTDAMRASVSAPGLLAPAERAGRLLVDGGLADNLPIDVARSMDVDVLIVVDAGFPLLKREQLNSVGVISNQMLAILIRRNSELQRAALHANDVVIDPALGEASSFDFTIVPQAIALGESAARGALPRLQALAAPPDAYARWMAQRLAARSPLPRIDFVHVAADSQRYAPALQLLFRPLVGQALDPDVMARRITSYYARGNLENLDYRVVQDVGADSLPRSGLELTATRNSWGPNYVRFGLNLQDDFEGNSTFNAAARFVMSELTSRGAEWVWDFQVGGTPRIATEFYLPLDYRSRWFLSPQATFEVRNVPLIRNGQRIADFRVRSSDFGLDLGRDFGSSGELRAGLHLENGSSRVRLGDPSLPIDNFNVREYFARYSYDKLDDVNFPRHGQSLTLEWRGARTDLGARDATDILKADYLYARSRGRNTAVFWSTFGSNLDAAGSSVRTLFPLGGFLNLSGVTPDAIAGKNFGIARLLLYRQVGRGGQGFLNVPTYAGISLEAGNVWDDRRDISFASARRDASIFFGLDTLLGPVYIATGFEQGGKTAFYLFLGRTF